MAPAPATPRIAAEAERIAATVLNTLDYVGVLGVELFERDDGRLLVNEFAPRVHNTGHWTLDGCEVDQFEQHIRAIAGWPLGPTAPIAHVEMTNLLGDGGRRLGQSRPRTGNPPVALWKARGQARSQDGPREPPGPAGEVGGDPHPLAGEGDRAAVEGASEQRTLQPSPPSPASPVLPP